MIYARFFTDDSGESHIEEIAVEFDLRDFAPPAPPLYVSSVNPATGFAVVRFPTGWTSDWHPAPRRQIQFFLAGEVEAETSDGTRRRFGPGTVTLTEDTTGRGHRTWVTSEVDALAAVVQLPD